MMMRLMSPPCKYPYIMLENQYRMHPSIAAFASQRFYGDKLQSVRAGGSDAKSWYCEAFLGPYALIDCKKGYEQRGNSGSYFNECEANCVAQLAMRFKQAHNIDTSCARNLVVITFYSAQVACIQRVLRTHGLGEVTVCSVDAFQGSEADIVLLSTVRANSKRSLGFLKDFRRLNVALTRAKHSLVVVTHCATLRGGAGEHDLQAMVKDATRRRVVFLHDDVTAALAKDAPPSHAAATTYIRAAAGTTTTKKVKRKKAKKVKTLQALVAAK
jgi:senataxin